MPREKAYYTMPQAARLIGDSRVATLNRAKLDGKVMGVPVIWKTPRQPVVSKAALDRVLAGETTEPTPRDLPWDVTTR